MFLRSGFSRTFHFQLLCSELFYVAKFWWCFQAYVLTSSQFPRILCPQSSHKLFFTGGLDDQDLQFPKSNVSKASIPCFKSSVFTKPFYLQSSFFFRKKSRDQYLPRHYVLRFLGCLKDSWDVPRTLISHSPICPFRILSQCSMFQEPFILRVQCFSRHYVLRFFECFKESWLYF